MPLLKDNGIREETGLSTTFRVSLNQSFRKFFHGGNWLRGLMSATRKRPSVLPGSDSQVKENISERQPGVVNALADQISKLDALRHPETILLLLRHAIMIQGDDTCKVG